MKRLYLLASLLLASCHTSPAFAGMVGCAITGTGLVAMGAILCLVFALIGHGPIRASWPDRWVMVIFIGLTVGLIASLPKTCNAAIPDHANKYRRDLVRLAHAEWGLDAPVATFAAQIHQESGWNAEARSRVGAEGLSQFMPGTAAWISRLRKDLAANEPMNPVWAMRSMIVYDGWLHQRVQARRPCDKWAMTLSAYNGGLGWVIRDKRQASVKGTDPLAWFNSVERHNSGRSTANFKENRDYPRKILLRWEPLYERAGWGTGVCS